MRTYSTLFLRFAIAAVGLAVAALCLFALPQAIISPDSGMYRPIFVGMYLPAAPFFVALYHAISLLRSIDAGTAFSASSARALRRIAYCGMMISAMYAIGMPYIFHVADLDDAPGVVLIGLVFAFAPLVVAVFAAVLERLVQSAAAMKSENDLIV